MVYITCKCEVRSLNSEQVFYSIQLKTCFQSSVTELDSCFGEDEMTFRAEGVAKNSFIRYVFGQETLVFDRKLSGKSQEILKLALRGNPLCLRAKGSST